MPSAPIAMPRAYWIWNDHDELSSQLILVEPNATEFDRVMRITESAAGGKYDMDILNDMYLASATIIPHRDYDLLTGEFKNKGPKDHKMYLGSDEAMWDPKAELARAKFLHFSDWPIPKVRKPSAFSMEVSMDTPRSFANSSILSSPGSTSHKASLTLMAPSARTMGTVQRETYGMASTATSRSAGRKCVTCNISHI